jgi:nitroimidazol reductase NimA-like FMN-containing flavoprotein (pyridoxamine 5'-phosphate oxidase superfamily)
MSGATGDESWRGGKAGAMSREEMNAFLAEPWIARLACLKPDGSPYLVPAWYHWDGLAFWFVARERSAWAHYIARDPRVSVVVDEPVPPIRKVMVEGTALIVEAAVGPYLENGEMSLWNRIGTNHTGPKYRDTYHTEQYRDSVSHEPCWTIKVVPRKLTTWQGLAWAKRYYHEELKGSAPGAGAGSIG